MGQKCETAVIAVMAISGLTGLILLTLGLEGSSSCMSNVTDAVRVRCYGFILVGSTMSTSAVTVTIIIACIHSKRYVLLHDV